MIRLPAQLMCLRSREPDKPEIVITVRGDHTYVIEVNKDQLDLLIYQAKQIRDSWPEG